MRFESREMSAESAAMLKERLEKLVDEFNQLRRCGCRRAAAAARRRRAARGLPAVAVLGAQHAQAAQGRLDRRRGSRSARSQLVARSRGLSCSCTSLHAGVRRGGPRRAQAASASTACCAPCTSASTLPSPRLRTQPVRPRRCGFVLQRVAVADALHASGDPQMAGEHVKKVSVDGGESVEPW